MRIKWYGQAAFLLTPDAGPRVVCDPYTPELLGYAPMTDPADIVLTSSDDDEAHCRARRLSRIEACRPLGRDDR